MRVVLVDGGADAVRALTRAVANALDGGEPVLPQDAAGAPANTDDTIEEDAAVVITTSGSTGAPKGVLLSARALMASATATHARLGGPGHWLLATPAHYIGGLQVLVRSLLAGTEPGVLDLAGGFRPDAFAEAAAPVLRRDGPRYTALVPTQLARLLAAQGPALAAARAFDAIVIGGAATRDELRERAQEAGVNIVSAYGMSETAGGCVYDGVPLDGVRVRVTDDGQVLLAGDVLANGYRDDPAATEAAFHGGWFHTSDLGRITDDGKLEVLGRADDVINTGGVKVAASAVENSLLRHPAVLEACVVGLPDAEWGEIVAAAVVVAGTPPAPDELTAHVRADRGTAAAPKRVQVLDALPSLGPGKADRAAVRAVLAAPARS